nr:MAG TPA: hypothetical protein [Caudoviricetes sp.]
MQHNAVQKHEQILSNKHSNLHKGVDGSPA